VQDIGGKAISPPLSRRWDKRLEKKSKGEARNAFEKFG